MRSGDLLASVPGRGGRDLRHAVWAWRFSEDGAAAGIASALAARNLAAIVKTHHGVDWMANVDHVAGAIDGPGQVAAIAYEFESRGVPFHAWCVMKGIDPWREAEIASVVLAAGTRSLVLDVENHPGFWEDTRKSALIFDGKLRARQPYARIDISIGHRVSERYHRHMATRSSPTAIETEPLTPDRWRDFSALMNSRFDTGRCWCMWPRLSVNYKSRSAEANRRSMKKAVDTAPAPPGVLAYVGGVPVGWCAVAPREDYPRLARSYVTAPLDKHAVWSVVCFYVLRSVRRRGVSRALLSAAIALAAQHGAKVIEAYPVEGGSNPFRGMPQVFADAGFREVARRKADRPFLRYVVRRR